MSEIQAFLYIRSRSHVLVAQKYRNATEDGLLLQEKEAPRLDLRDNALTHVTQTFLGVLRSSLPSQTNHVIRQSKAPVPCGDRGQRPHSS